VSQVEESLGASVAIVGGKTVDRREERRMGSYNGGDHLQNGLIGTLAADFVNDGTPLELEQLGGGPEHEGVEFSGKDLEVRGPRGLVSQEIFVHHDEHERQPRSELFQILGEQVLQLGILGGENEIARDGEKFFIFRDIGLSNNTSSSTLGSKICHSDIGIDIDARFFRQPGDEIVGLTLEVGRIWEVGGGGHGWGEEEERIGEGRMREQKKERRRGG
jgi:hypothetical protein